MAEALLLIDVQMDFATRREAGRPWGNPEADLRIAELLAAFRAKGLPVWHVHHHGTDPRDPLHKDAAGSAVQPCAAPLPGEPVVIKQTSSAFVHTGLEAALRDAGITELVIAGGAANFCVESTTRMAADLGFRARLAEDALINLGSRLRDGTQVPASQVLAMSLANLDGEFAELTSAAEVIAGL
jgi:nicotinamidase-related amidase